MSSNIGVWLYDVQTGKEISLFTGICGAVVFSPDGRFLAHGWWRLLFQFRYPAVGQTMSNYGKSLPVVRCSSLMGPPAAAAALGFSEDGRSLISLGKSRVTISRLDIRTRKRTENKLGERPGYVHLETYALVPDKLAIGMDNGNVELWDTTTGKKLSTIRENAEKLPVPDELIGMMEDNNSVFVLAFSPDGTRACQWQQGYNRPTLGPSPPTMHRSPSKNISVGQRH